MADKEIKIVRKAGDRIEPESGFSTQVPAGATVMFTTEPGAQGLTIAFEGDSPFGPGKQVVSYGTSLTITAAFDPSNREKNVYRYRCEIMVGGRKLSSTAGAGGEMEVIR